MQLAITRSIRFLAIALSIALSACANESQSIPTVSLDAELQASYDRSCKSCHEIPATKSPQTGDVAHWKTILEKGIEPTLERAINGYQGMPPGGQCFECTPEQLKTLIYYMAQPTP